MHVHSLHKLTPARPLALTITLRFTLTLTCELTLTCALASTHTRHMMITLSVTLTTDMSGRPLHMPRHVKLTHTRTLTACISLLLFIV